MERSQRESYRKDELTWPAHILTCSPHVLSHVLSRLITCLSIKRYQFTGRDMPLQKSSEVAILVSLQECGFFLHVTVHRKANSRKPQVKIRFTQKRGLVPLRVFSLKRSTAGAFTVRFRVLSRKNMTGDNLLF